MTFAALQIPRPTFQLPSLGPGGQTVLAVLLFFLVLAIAATTAAGRSPVLGGAEEIPFSLPI